MRAARSASPTCCARCVLETPPNVVEGIRSPRSPSCVKAGRLAQPAARARRSTCSATCSTCSPSRAGDYLDGWFESDADQGRVTASTRIVGNYASPYTPGSAYVLLHHVFGEVNGKKGAWGHAHRRHGRDHAGDGEVGARRAASRSAPTRAVREVIVENGRARRRRDRRAARRSARARVVVEPQSEAAVSARWSIRPRCRADFRARIAN